MAKPAFSPSEDGQNTGATPHTPGASHLYAPAIVKVLPKKRNIAQSGIFRQP